MRNITTIQSDFNGNRRWSLYSRSHLNFKSIAKAARERAETLVKAWLPEGRRHGKQWVALNPTRIDRHPGSFTISLRTGKWADFATGDSGGDLISLLAYLGGTSQFEAARRLAEELGL